MSAEIAPEEADYAVLLIGNSHVSRGNLPGVLQQLLVSSGSGAAIVQTARDRAFLAGHLENNRTRSMLASRPWTHVVLQAQKYSTTGRYTYPTAAAEEWIRRSRRSGAQPILFPEWARRGHAEEGARVHQLHEGIAAREPACVAPVGPAWEIMLDTNPDLRLHERDGNHANRKGALLTAYVLYATITGHSPDDLPQAAIRGVTGEEQKLLRAAAQKALSLNPPCALLLSRIKKTVTGKAR